MDLLGKLLKEEAEKGATTINLSDRQLTAIPNEVFLLKSLGRIGLSNNSLTSLPKEFASLTNLVYINLKSNLLSEIPNCLCTLPHLEILDVSRNKMFRLPDRPGFLINLRILNISRNKLVSLPLWMGNMKKLELLQLHKNPLEWPPKEIIECHSSEQEVVNEWLVNLKNYLKEFSQLKNPKENDKTNTNEAVQIQDKIQTLVDILQESLSIQWKSSLKISFKVFHACHIFISVLDTFFRTFLGQSSLETGILVQEDFIRLQNSATSLAYCIMGLNPKDLAKYNLKEAISDLNNFLNSYNVPKERSARFQMLGYYSMSVDIGKGIFDLSNSDYKPDARSYKSEIISLGKSVLFSLSEVESPSDNVILFEKRLEQLPKTNDYASFSEVLLQLVKEIDAKGNREVLRQIYELIQVVQNVL